MTVSPRRSLVPSASPTGSLLVPLLLILVPALVKLWIGSRVGLANDEAYYWCWSRHLDYWYFDQGPGIAWSLRLCTAIFGDTLFAIRLCPVLYSIGSLLFLFFFVRNASDHRTACWTLVLANAAPLLSMGGMIATYDAPQVFFWCGCLWALERALSGQRIHWITCSFLCLLGSFSKIPMVFFPIGALLAMWANPTWRPFLRNPGPWICGVVGVGGLGAMLLWDFQHDHLYTLHTANLGRRHTGALPGRWVADFFVGQAASVGPTLWIAELAGLWLLMQRRPHRIPISDTLGRFALAFTLPMLLVCVVNATRSKLEINWPISAHMTGIALVAAWWSQLWHAGRRPVVVLMLVPCLLIQGISWYPELVTLLGLRPTGRAVSKLTENRAWDRLENAMREEAALLRSERGTAPFRAAVNYKMSAILSYLAPDKEETACLFPGTRRNQFFLWTKVDDLIGRDAVIAFDEDPEKRLEVLRSLFNEVSPPRRIDAVEPAFRGPIKTWYVVRARQFLGYDPDKTAVGH